MKKQINDLLLKMQTGENCIGEPANKLLDLYNVSNSLTSKEAIDYEIYAKRKDKEENLKSWLYAMLFGIMFFVVLFAMLKSCSS